MAETIGDRIKKRRQALGISVKDLARKAGLAETTLYDLEAGNSKTTTKLHRVAAALNNTSLDYLEFGRLPIEVTGVLDTPASYDLSQREQMLLENYRASDDDARRIIEGTASLAAQPKKKNGRK